MRSKWTHSICDKCWIKKNPDREPARLRYPLMEKCCYCGEMDISGIFVRENPADMLCNGVHNEDQA